MAYAFNIFAHYKFEINNVIYIWYIHVDPYDTDKNELIVFNTALSLKDVNDWNLLKFCEIIEHGVEFN